MTMIRSYSRPYAAGLITLIAATTSLATAQAQNAAVAPPPPSRDADSPPPTPFVLSEHWFMGVTGQLESRAHKDADLESSVEGDVANIKPGVKIAFLYEVPGSFRFFSATKINRDLVVNEGANPEHRELLAELDEFYARWIPFQNGIVSVGRSRMNDPRNWLFASSDDMNDNVQLQYRDDTDFFQVVAAARDLLPSNLFEPSDQHRSLNYAATFEHNFPNGMRGGGFLLLQNRKGEGDGVDRTYFGVRSRGTVAGHIDYWTDTVVLRGAAGTTPMRSYAFDVGIIYKFLDALQLHLVGSYAYGSGDGNAGDGVDHRFRQTGIQENRYQYGGVSRFKYYGESLNPELSNLAVATTAVGFKPSTLSSVDLVAHHYELAHANGGLIAGRLNRQPTGASHNAGNALDLVAGYRDRTAVELEFFGGWFMPGPAFGAHRTDSVYGMFKLKYNLSP
ncbi:MAG: alginate export family protein [Proteobacteria bacterium]|nr:alginate export family protein [Pseudomonadota bacterium]